LKTSIKKKTAHKSKEPQMHASGQFDIEMKPLDSYAKAIDGVTLGRMSIDKTFTGDLVATSQGEMLTAMTPVKGSAGYVAIEQVNGELDGKVGSFVLQHYGIMDSKGQNLTLVVVPDSGSNELKNLSGTMNIQIENGQHFYAFEYQFADDA
jgi:hypothetical protein